MRGPISKAALVLILALAAGLRLLRLGTKSFWLDEAISAVLAQTDWHTFLGALIHRQGNMALYYFLLRLWIRLGNSEFVLRSFSVIAGVAAVAAIYLLGKNLFGPRAGLVAALLLAVHVFHIRYSQEARSYSLLALLAVLSSLFFLLTLQAPTRKHWAAYVITSALTVYAQVFGCWLLFAQWGSLIFRRREAPWKALAGAVVAICILVSPLAYCLLFVSDRSQLAWVTRFSWNSLFRFCFDLTGDGGILLLILYFVLTLAAILVGVMRTRTPLTSTQAWEYFFLLGWLLLPITALIGLSVRWPVFESRFLIFCVPALVLLVSGVLAQVRSNIFFATVLIMVLVPSLNGAYFYYQSRTDAEHTDDWRDATRYVMTHATSKDAVLFTYSEERLAFDEYATRFSSRPLPFDEFPERSQFELLTLRPSRPSSELVVQIAAQCSRVWELTAYKPNEPSRKVDVLLQTHYGQHTTQNFGFVRAEIFANPIPAGADGQTHAAKSSRINLNDQ